MIKFYRAVAYGPAAHIFAVFAAAANAAIASISGAGAAVVAAIAVAGAAAVEVVAYVGDRSAERRDRREREAQLFKHGRFPTTVHDALAGEGRYSIGVDPETDEALRAILGDSASQTYFTRDIDREASEFVETAIATPRCSTLVIKGVAKAGKSRALTEALAASAHDALLVRPRNPAALTEISARRPGALEGRVVVFWLDDLEDWILASNSPLRTETLELLDEWSSPVLIAGCLGGRGIGSLGGQSQSAIAASPIFALINGLRNQRGNVSSVITLSAEPSESETAFLNTTLDPAVTHEIQHSGGIGSFLIAGPQLRERVESAGIVERAVISAAVAVRRLGVVDPLRAETLSELHALFVPPPHRPAEDITDALIWATERIFESSLLTAVGSTSEPRYELRDYIARVVDVPVADGKFLDRFVESAGATDAVRFGNALLAAGHVERGLVVLERGTELGNLDSAREFIRALMRLDRFDEAEEGAAALAARLPEANPPDLDQRQAEALLFQGEAALGREGFERAIAIFGSLDSKYGASESSSIRNSVASALERKISAHLARGEYPIVIELASEMKGRYAADSDPHLRCQLAVCLNARADAIELGEEDYAKALAGYEYVIRAFGNDPAAQMRYPVAYALVGKSDALMQLHEYGDSIDAADEAFSRFGNDNSQRIREQVASGLVTKCLSLNALSDYETLETTSDFLVQRFAEDTAQTIRDRVAEALALNRFALKQKGETSKVLVVCDEIISRFGSEVESEYRMHVAEAFADKAWALKELGRPTEALSTIDEAVERFGRDHSENSRHTISTVLITKILALEQQSEVEKVNLVCGEIISRYGSEPDTKFRERVALAFAWKIWAVHDLGGPETTVNLVDEADALYGQDRSSDIRKSVSYMLSIKRAALVRLEKLEALLAVCDEIISRYGSETGSVFAARVGSAYSDKAWALKKLGQLENVVSFVDEVDERHGRDNSTDFRDDLSYMLGVKLSALWDRGEIETAISTCDEIISRYGSEGGSDFRERVSGAFAWKTKALLKLNRNEEAISLADEADERYRRDNSEDIRLNVSHLLDSKRSVLMQEGEIEMLLSTCNEIIARYGSEEGSDFRRRVAAAFASKASALHSLKLPAECTKSVIEFETSIPPDEIDTPYIKLQLADAHISAANCLLEVGNMNSREAYAQFDSALELVEPPEGPPERFRVIEARIGCAVAEIAGNRPDGPEYAIQIYRGILGRFSSVRDSRTREWLVLTRYRLAEILERDRSSRDVAIAEYLMLVEQHQNDDGDFTPEYVALSLRHAGRLFLASREIDQSIECYDRVVQLYEGEVELYHLVVESRAASMQLRRKRISDSVTWSRTRPAPDG